VKHSSPLRPPGGRDAFSILLRIVRGETPLSARGGGDI